MKVELPTRFEIIYPKRNIKYYSAYGKSRLGKTLYDSCNGYCMYCGRRVNIEGDKNYHIEHSVDKDGNVHQELDSHGVLEHCKFNLAIACAKCNMVCKKVVDKIDISKYAPLPKCPSECDDMCEVYSNIRSEYIKKNAIILQPKGIQEPVPYVIEYDLLKHIYVPSSLERNDEVVFAIQNHIDRFELNGDRFSTAVIEICAKIVLLKENGICNVVGILDVLREEKHLNVIGEEFCEFIREYFSNKPVGLMIDFCKMLVVLDALP